MNWQHNKLKYEYKITIIYSKQCWTFWLSKWFWVPWSRRKFSVAMKITLSLYDLGIDASPSQSLCKTIELNCQTVVQVISRKFLNSRQKLNTHMYNTRMALYKCIICIQTWLSWILTHLQMTKLVLPRMVEKRKGIVVNISSLSGDFARNVYSASKVHNWY